MDVIGKKKSPKFEARSINGDQVNKTKMYVDNGHRKFEAGNINDFRIDEKRKLLEINFRLPPVRPIWVYQALLKIALSLVPFERRSEYAASFDWLLGKDVILYVPSMLLFKITLKKKKFAEPRAMLFEAKQTIDSDGTFLPDILVVGFGNIVYQIFLPAPLTYKDVVPSLMLYPSFLLDTIDDTVTETKINYIDLNIDESIELDQLVSLSFQNIHKSPQRE
jgi:hypothetical protein